jgi:hypothetical protein
MRIRPRYSTRRPEGMAVIALIALIAIILIFVAGNLRTVHLLRSDLRLIERQQTNHWATVRLATNSLAVTNTNPPSRVTHGAPDDQGK